MGGPGTIPSELRRFVREEVRSLLGSDEVLQADQVAQLLGVDRKTVYEAAGRGEIPHRRLGRRLLFSRSAILAWLNSCRSASHRQGD